MIVEENKIGKPGKVPPDGGWGWVVVGGFAAYYSIILPLFINFGIIYKNKLDAINMPATDVSIIINIGAALGSVLGLAAVPFIKSYGCRRVAIVSALLFILGIFLTIFANSFFKFFVFYGLITSFGLGLGYPAFYVCMTSYFVKHLNKASGLAMTLTAIGNIGYPPLVTHLLEHYGSDGCILILTGINLNLIAAALVLQPVKWHLVDEVIDVEQDLTPNDEAQIENDSRRLQRKRSSFKSTDNVEKLGTILHHHQLETSLVNRRLSTQLSTKSKDEELKPLKHQNQDNLEESLKSNESTACFMKSYKWIVETFDLALLKDKIFVNVVVGLSLFDFSEINFVMITPFILSDLKYTTIEIAGFQSTVATADIIFRFISPFIGDYFNQPPRIMFIYSLVIFLFSRTGRLQRKRSSFKSTDNVEKLGTILHHHQLETSLVNRRLSTQLSTKSKDEELKPLKHQNQDNLEESLKSNESTACFMKSYKWIVETFDLALLKDKIFVNVVVGLSLFDFSEINFVMITPFILSDLKYTTIEIAGFQSTVATADIIFRFISPFIGDYFNQPPRIMFIYSLVIFLFSRTGLMMAQTYLTLLIVGVVLGCAKGLSYVYWNVVIPTVVPIERLAAASGIQMFINGVLMISTGPFIGYLRDITGNYWFSIFLLHFTTLLALILWSVELIYMKLKKRKN